MNMHDRRFTAYVALQTELTASDLYFLALNTLATMGFFSYMPSIFEVKNLVHQRRCIQDSDLFILVFSSNLFTQATPQILLHYLYAKEISKPILIFDIADQLPMEIREQALFDLRLYQDIISEMNYIKVENLFQFEGMLRNYLMEMLTTHEMLGWMRPNQGVKSWLNERQELLEQIHALQERLDQLEQTSQPVETWKAADFIRLHFTAHLYIHGNFRPVELEITLTLEQLLIELGPAFEVKAPEENFRTRLIRYISERAIDLAKIQFPDTHAVTRIQIRPQDLFLIKSRLKQKNWIVPLMPDIDGQIEWQLTPDGGSKMTHLLILLKTGY